jgi:Ni/Co efflux regulator RcnB
VVGESEREGSVVWFSIWVNAQQRGEREASMQYKEIQQPRKKERKQRVQQEFKREREKEKREKREVREASSSFNNGRKVPVN